MIAKVNSFTNFGIEAYQVIVEVDVAHALPAFHIVGLPDKAVEEAKERVRSAIRNSNYEMPNKKITVNLAPADVKKQGPIFDLPIAVGILSAAGYIKKEKLKEFVLIGELSLDGNLRKVNGVLPICISCEKQNIKNIILPTINAKEAALIRNINIYPFNKLSEVIEFLNDNIEKEPYKEEINIDLENPTYDVDFSEVKAQEVAKRALEIASAGAHNVLMIGPPGAGKTMLAKRLPTILPTLTFDEAIEVTKLYSTIGKLNENKPLITERPFRSPHHTASVAGLIGGGTFPKPGELSLAHCGVLFLDELPEFHRDVLEVLRQPMEEGIVNISRAKASISYPANFMIVCAMNPCPCGYFGDTIKQCICTPAQINKYRRRISGPLLDRIDIHIEVPRIDYDKLTKENETEPESSQQIRERVNRARKIQLQRFKLEKFYTNSGMKQKHIKKYCKLPPEAAELLKNAMINLGLSARAYTRILKIARTIADLSGRENIETSDVAEAIQYRTLDRKMWM